MGGSFTDVKESAVMFKVKIPILDKNKHKNKGFTLIRFEKQYNDLLSNLSKSNTSVCVRRTVGELNITLKRFWK